MPIKKSVNVIPAFAKLTSESKRLGGTSAGAYVLTIVASKKRRMNHGIAIFALAPPSLRRYIIIKNSATGAIHNARASFTVVAISSASCPYAAAAPTTELVSCIAIAAQTPNCFCVRFIRCPTTGNSNNAIEFNIKTLPRATDISSVSASIAGPTAAIALPPQIAVPDEISVDVFSATPNHLPTKYPRINVPKIDAIVKSIPSFPAWITAERFIPNPRRITDACKRYFVGFPVTKGNGLPSVKASNNPRANAIGGEPIGERLIKARIMNMALCHIGELFLFSGKLIICQPFLDLRQLFVRQQWPRHRLGNNVLLALDHHRVRKQEARRSEYLG